VHLETETGLLLQQALTVTSHDYFGLAHTGESHEFLRSLQTRDEALRGAK
jgi:hypothetical protein